MLESLSEIEAKELLRRARIGQRLIRTGAAEPLDVLAAIVWPAGPLEEAFAVVLPCPPGVPTATEGLST